ncbi:transposase [Actinoallomurus sp. NBC_01490]|uniref:transposase n=1 Tax=Actinoallomurus sp. NBC_01490 TaxID=2903557 RepID=UPI003FA4298B
MPRPWWAYAEAVRTAAPDAVQVANRFHIWKNLCEAVEKCVMLHHACQPEPTSDNEPDQATSVPPEATASAAVPAEWEGVRVAMRRERHAAVHDLLAKAWGSPRSPKRSAWSARPCAATSTPPPPRT